METSTNKSSSEFKEFLSCFTEAQALNGKCQALEQQAQALKHSRAHSAHSTPRTVQIINLSVSGKSKETDTRVSQSSVNFYLAAMEEIHKKAVADLVIETKTLFLSQHNEYYSLAKKLIADYSHLHINHKADLAVVETAISSVNALDPGISTLKDVKRVLLGAVNAAMKVVSMQQATIAHLRKKEIALETENQKLKSRITSNTRDTLTAADIENRPIKVNKITASIIVKLAALKNEGLVYEGRSDVRTKRTGGLDSWLKPMFCNPKYKHRLTDSEYALAKENSTVFKTFDAKLHRTVRAAIAR
jgi:hypothetical protein